MFWLLVFRGLVISCRLSSQRCCSTICYQGKVGGVHALKGVKQPLHFFQSVSQLIQKKCFNRLAKVLRDYTCNEQTIFGMYMHLIQVYLRLCYDQSHSDALMYCMFYTCTHSGSPHNVMHSSCRMLPYVVCTVNYKRFLNKS